jgi:putative radical SAM enzyme (TIGR03279 family)
MPPKSGIEIETVLKDSLAEQAGLEPGDLLASINSHKLHDAIDLMFHRDLGTISLEFYRNGQKNSVKIPKPEEADLGITVKPFKVKTCKNNCVFCFVKQLPKGLRKSLYVKDEDYRLSFLYGNYITLSNMDSRDRKRIIEQRLSPLYISVHTTNKALRARMLGGLKACDIMKELEFFASHKIRMHTQIVLCPGYNDGLELQNTIRDLYKYFPYISSIAVVPVGLTMHRRQKLTPVSKEDALRAIETVNAFQKRFMKRHGDQLVFCSDELYIKAGLPFPHLKEYGVLPQLENGVGMVPLFMSQARKIRIPEDISKDRHIITVTGKSFFPFLKKFADRLREKESVAIDVMPVENHFFGTTVTVTGLLTGRDIIKTLHDNIDDYKVLLVPDTALKEDEDIFLDNVTLNDVQSATGLKVVRTEATPQGLIDAIAHSGR